MKKIFALLLLVLSPIMGQAATDVQPETQQNISTPPTVEVRRGGLINATFAHAYWRKGKVEIAVDITTPMVRRQFRITDSSAKDANGDYVRVARVNPSGIKMEPGRDYYVITDHDTARLDIAVSKMPEHGSLQEVKVYMSLSGAKEWVIIRNVSW